MTLTLIDQLIGHEIASFDDKGTNEPVVVTVKKLHADTKEAQEGSLCVEQEKKSYHLLPLVFTVNASTFVGADGLRYS